MTMAHDSSPGPAALADETIGGDRSALLEYVDEQVRFLQRVVTMRIKEYYAG
jgi:hypothetical protein